MCTICSCYDCDVISAALSDDLEPYHLDLLCVPEYLMSSELAAGNGSLHFTYGNACIDGLMLAPGGLVYDVSAAVGMTACKSCVSTLCSNKMSQLALVNNLYRGSLPPEFLSLMWVEENICVIYSITTHVTRFSQPSDPAQPKVFHGNTCTHDMNVMSTFSVLLWTIMDINGFISVVFIGPEKFDLKWLATLFQVQKQKIWFCLTWLTHNNHLYAGISLDETILDTYPDNSALTGLCDAVMQDYELNASTAYLICEHSR
jgi:hypothetical protein